MQFTSSLDWDDKCEENSDCDGTFDSIYCTNVKLNYKKYIGFNLVEDVAYSGGFCLPTCSESFRQKVNGGTIEVYMTCDDSGDNTFLIVALSVGAVAAAILIVVIGLFVII
mmetsp:Transcript_33018/g.50586  ORF Transcript_33018/g.50586 Transcript_33018/m.50586 type:complete len:111 (-) Transcript_33018:75-407(-)